MAMKTVSLNSLGLSGSRCQGPTWKVSLKCVILAAAHNADSYEGIPRKDGDLIAMSFISGEDLERG